MVITSLIEYPQKRLIFNFYARHGAERKDAWAIVEAAGFGGKEYEGYIYDAGENYIAYPDKFDRRLYLSQAKEFLTEIGEAKLVYSEPTDDCGGFDGAIRDFRFQGAEPTGYVELFTGRYLGWSVPVADDLIQLNGDQPDPNTPMRVVANQARVLPI